MKKFIIFSITLITLFLIVILGRPFNALYELAWDVPQFIKFNGDMRFNIIIRSILNYKNISEISVASGVVIDSTAKNEFNENYIKAKSLIDLYK